MSLQKNKYGANTYVIDNMFIVYRKQKLGKGAFGYVRKGIRFVEDSGNSNPKGCATTSTSGDLTNDSLYDLDYVQVSLDPSGNSMDFVAVNPVRREKEEGSRAPEGIKYCEEVAVKEIPDCMLDHKLKGYLNREISVLSNHNHPNLVKLLYTTTLYKKPSISNSHYSNHSGSGNAKAEAHRVLVLELCKGGSLDKYLKDHAPLPHDRARHLLLQLASGLKCLREKNLVHRDLKPQNLLLTDTSRYPCLKIADLGFVRELEDDCLAHTIAGSPLYMAPEILNRSPDGYRAEVDLWSVGCILYEMLTSIPPFKGPKTFDTLREKINKTPNGEITLDDENVPIECRDLVRRLLQIDPKKRITFEEFFQHPYICADSTLTQSMTTLRFNVNEDSIAAQKSIRGQIVLDHKPIVFYHKQSGQKFSIPHALLETRFQPKSKKSPRRAQKQQNVPKISNDSSVTIKRTTSGASRKNMDVNAAVNRSILNPIEIFDNSSLGSDMEDVFSSISLEAKRYKTFNSTNFVSEYGEFVFPDAVFDFSNLSLDTTDKQQIQAIEEAEHEGRLAWYISEYALQQYLSGNFSHSFVLLTHSCEILKQCLHKLNKGIMKQSIRLYTLKQWAQKHFLQFVQNAEMAHKEMYTRNFLFLEDNNDGQNIYDIVQHKFNVYEILYDYIFNLGRQAAMTEMFSNSKTQQESSNSTNESKNNSEELYRRCVALCRHILSIAGTTTDSNKLPSLFVNMKNYLELFESRLDKASRRKQAAQI